MRYQVAHKVEFRLDENVATRRDRFHVIAAHDNDRIVRIFDTREGAEGHAFRLNQVDELIIWFERIRP
jgi:hypothetical protein